MKLQSVRTRYEHCPLCESSELADLCETSCSEHSLYREELEDTIDWRGCGNCGHIFSAGYHTTEALQLLGASGFGSLSEEDIDLNRRSSARIVETVTMVRGELAGRWLDVGFGDGALLTTADEFGYECTGVDWRPTAAMELEELGYDVRSEPFSDFEEPDPYLVVSMDDVLHKLPHPKRALEHAHDLMIDDGVLFVSAPNVDCFPWRISEKRGTNPYWAAIDNYHHFGRDRLYLVLREAGFEPCHYAACDQRRAYMEVIAVKV